MEEDVEEYMLREEVAVAVVPADMVLGMLMDDDAGCLMGSA